MREFAFGAVFAVGVQLVFLAQFGFEFGCVCAIIRGSTWDQFLRFVQEINRHVVFVVCGVQRTFFEAHWKRRVLVIIREKHYFIIKTIYSLSYYYKIIKLIINYIKILTYYKFNISN